MFTYSPLEKIIVYKITPFKSLYTLDSSHWVVTWMIHSYVFFCLVIVVHESLVCPEQLNFLLFFWKSFSHRGQLSDNWGTTEGQLKDSYATITEGSNAHWCSRRKNHARAGGWKLLNKMKMCTFFLFCLNVFFSLFSTGLQKLQKIVSCFPEDKISSMYPDLQINKTFLS